MARYTEAEKAEAIELWTEHGACEAARRTGIPKGTISSWAHRDGTVQPVADQRARYAIERAQQAWALRRAAMADELGELAAMALDLTRQSLEGRNVRNARDGAHTAETLIRNAQLLSGEATNRTETLAPDRAPEYEEVLNRTLRLVQDKAS